MRRGEIWLADLGPHRPLEQTGSRPVVIWQGDALIRQLESRAGRAARRTGRGHTLPVRR